MIFNKYYVNSFIKIVQRCTNKQTKFCNKSFNDIRKDIRKYLKNLTKFVRNSCYWSRFNNKIDDYDFPFDNENDIRGKTLNQKCTY